jgi:hypothetical protein
MNDLAALVRRHWQVALALVLCAVFAAVHAAAFGPALARYRRIAHDAAELGMSLDPADAHAGMPARVAALLADNSLVAELAEEQGNSGALTAGLLDQVTGMAARSGLALHATEQGLVTQLPGSVQVRAHLRMRGTYADFTRFLAAAAGSRTLVGVDRFTIKSAGGGDSEIEAWVTQVVLKRSRGKP